MTTLLIASGNAGKLREFEAILASLGLEGLKIEFVLPKNVGIELDIVEDGATYAQNAAKKAVAYARASGLVTLADDSGLEVDALGGEPGLYSARYAPWPGATDADRRQVLLQNLRDFAQPWPAHFHCTIAIATPQGDVYYAEGDCPGEIISEERGSNGFGYDPIFYLPELGKTMAELPGDKKNRLSHRARATIAAIPVLKQLFGSSNSPDVEPLL